jgi:hypothetical protein
MKLRDTIKQLKDRYQSPQKVYGDVIRGTGGLRATLEFFFGKKWDKIHQNLVKISVFSDSAGL